MKRNRVTSKDVAKHAGVSQTTVSFVLNRNKAGKISNETAERVWEAARKLGYVPDSAARSLARGHSMNLALVITNPHMQVFIDEYIPNVITGVTEAVNSKGFRVLLELAEERAADTIREMAYGREVAGILVSPYGHVEPYIDALLELRRNEFPIVTLGNLHPSLPSVEAANLSGIQTMTEHLIQLGHKRIACISYSPFSTNPHTTSRMKAIHETLRDHDLTLPDEYVVSGEFDPHTGYAATNTLLRLPTPPTAIQCLNDTMALGAIAAIQDHGLRVPEDIAVVGFDDIRHAPFITPALTTVRAPEIELGGHAGKIILDLIGGYPAEVPHIELQTELVIRSSCGANDQHSGHYRQ